jgi:hypothetical protein
VTAMVNALLLFGMAVASFNSLPPRNPVFRLWNIIPTEYETDNLDTDDDHSVDPENPRSNRAALAQILEETDEGDDAHESVSLFGSNKSVSSTRRASSVKSESVGSKRSKRSGSVKIPPGKNKKDAPSVGSGKGSVRSDGGSKSGAKSKKSERSAKTTSSSLAVLADGCSSVTSNKTDPSGSIINLKNSNEEKSVKSTGSSPSRSSKNGSTNKSVSKAVESDADSVGLQLERLGRSTVLGPGGIRISETRFGRRVEIVDEYPAAASGEGLFVLADTEGTDIVKVRTEYCPEGRKTSKETVHNDGSRTVATLLDPMTIDGVIENALSPSHFGNV